MCRREILNVGTKNKKELCPVSKQQFLFIVEDSSSIEWYQVGVLDSVYSCYSVGGGVL